MANHQSIKPAEYLEFLIDRSTVAEVLATIATICEEKGEHILTTWQDRPLAKTWYDAGKVIEKIASRVTV